MAKPIPTLKKPNASLPVDAMTAFVSGQVDAPAAAFPAPRVVSIEPENAPPSADLAEVAAADEASATIHSIDTEKASPRRTPSKPQTKSGRRVETRSDGSLMRKVTIHLEVELDKQLSLHAVTKGVDRSVIVAEALTRLLRREG